MRSFTYVGGPNGGLVQAYRTGNRLGSALLATVAAVVLALTGACVSPQSFQPTPELSELAADLEALERRIRASAPYPAAELMSSEVRLFSPTRIGAYETGLGFHYPVGARPQRDTISGADAVAGWLEARSRTYRGQDPFRLVTTHVRVCDGAILQYGHYPVVARRAEVTRPFFALWRLDEADGLRLVSLWLSPRGPETRPGAGVGGCRDVHSVRQAVRYATRWTGVQLIVGASSDGAATVATDQLAANGWTESVNSSTAFYMAGAQGFLRFLPAWSVAGIAAYDPGFSVSARPPGAAYIPTLRSHAFSTAAVLVYEAGRIRLSAGPEVTYTRWHWTERHLHPHVEPADPSAGSSLTLGGLLGIGIARPLWSNVYLDLAGQYRTGGTPTAPEFRDMAPIDTPVGGASLIIGVGWWR